jgi:hypothetical protein
MGDRIGVSVLCLAVAAGCADDGSTARTSSRGDASVATDAAPPDAGGRDVTVDMQAFPVPPGGERYKCQNFANPFGGENVDIDRFEAHMPEGAHHMIVFFVDETPDGPLEDCSGSEFHPNVFGSQTPDGVIDLPEGVGVTIPPTTSLRLQIHFINEGEEEVSATVHTRFHVAEPGTITEHAGQLLFSNLDIAVPPLQTATVTKTCAVPTELRLLGASAHIHRHAIDFLATAGDQVLYQTKGWSDLTPARFDPPLLLPAGQEVTFACTFRNDGSTPLAFGESALTDEMCILGGIYYPVDDIANPNILCF